MKAIKTIGLSIITTSILVSCGPTGVVDKDPVDTSDTNNEEVSETPKIDQAKEVKDTLLLDNGIKIKWFEHGEGEQMKYGELYAIDFRVMIDNGDIVDGNHLLKKESIPFMIGFEIQTPGWDIALKNLKVGDFAEVFIPSDLARGENGIKDLIPPNANNILRIRILKKIKPDRSIDGNRVWIFERNESNTLGFDDSQELIFHTITSSQTNPRYVNSFMDGRPFSMRLADYGIVPGLKKALINAKKADRMFVFVPASEAYKSKGYLDVVKPNEDLLYNMFIMDVIEE